MKSLERRPVPPLSGAPHSMPPLTFSIAARRGIVAIFLSSRKRRCYHLNGGCPLRLVARQLCGVCSPPQVHVAWCTDVLQFRWSVQSFVLHAASSRLPPHQQK